MTGSLHTSRVRLSDPVFSPELNAMVLDYLATEGGTPEKNQLRDQIVKTVMPYVKKMAYGLARRANDPVEDLIQVGNIGLMKALDKYNPLAGSSFKTYATYLITGEIRHYLRDKSTIIKAPRQMYELYYRINQIIQRLSDELNRTPTDEEIAEALQCPLDKVHQAQESDRRRQTISLDQFALNESDGDNKQYVERLVDTNYQELLQTQENKMVLEQALSSLSADLKLIVQMTFFQDMSQSDIAKQLGISQMQVSRKLRKALSQLSTSFGQGGQKTV